MGTLWTGKSGWRLAHDSGLLTLTTDGATEEFVGEEAARLRVTKSWFRHSLRVDGSEPKRLKGLSRHDAQPIKTAIDAVVARAKFDTTLQLIVRRREDFEALITRHRDEQRWIAHDSAQPVIDGIPTRAELTSLATSAEFQALVPHLSNDEARAVRFLDEDHRKRIATVNDEIRRREMTLRHDFFANVEKSPLTDEQKNAVITFDNRVRVIAAAGSGKTSVMVARAAYAIERGFVPPHRILMLAFNTDAAAELRERVRTRLGALGLSSEGVQASTFHAYGLALIGKATGRKPSIAPWVENGKDIAKIEQIVDELRDESVDFRFKWDAFRLLYGRMSDEPDGGEPDSYDRKSRVTGFETYRGETVRSEGERLIADWLFLNGVNYEYERPYDRDVADAEHSQYRPDFFYPDVQVWHEHWAVRADGTPPESFEGYAESMEWKRLLHRQNGTTLVETTWHEIIDLSGFEALEKDLRGHGLELDWNPDRPIPGAKPLEHERLARLVRTFLSHVKSSSLTREDVDSRLRHFESPRSRLFLDLYWRIHERWQAELRAAEVVDFDDMLLQAAELVEQDPSLGRFDLVMVDEFQDTSRARARLTKALVNGDGKYMLAVGDDWQAINRFAGADLSIMTKFSQYFGQEQTRRLQTTFRCTQTIADVASRFVSRNPAQISKKVTSIHTDRGAPVTIIRVEGRESIPGAIEQHLSRLAAEAPGSSVDVLGRYRFERDLVPRRRFAELNMTFRTVHSSKGLEADHVVLPNLTTGTFGFPSQISDDPVLALAMSSGDDFEHSEERRLFYVALTRARKSVTIFTVAGLESPFVVELLSDPGVVVAGAEGVQADVQPCPGCGEGTLVPRTGPYGDFLGCSRFPKCRQTAQI